MKAGTYLGDEGKVGCASGDHLHFEVGVPRKSNPISTTGGFLKDNSGSKRNRIPRICGISGRIFASGTSYDARKVPGNIKKGRSEVARHGVPARDFQCLFDQATGSGYELKWIDGFDKKGKVYYNAIFGRKGRAKWVAYFGLTGKQYQARLDQYTKRGYRPVQVETYRRGTGVRYALILKKKSGPKYVAYHGLSASKHQKRTDDLVKQGFRPKNVAVASVKGTRYYTALYEKTNIGSFQAKSFLTQAAYQKLFDENKKKGRQIAYLNGYEHKGKPYLSAIWNSKTKGAYKARHNLSGSQYQSEWQKATKAGYRTRNVTGYTAGSSVKYGGVWRK